MKLEHILTQLSVSPVMGEPFNKENTFAIKVDDFKTELLHLKDQSKTSLFQIYMDEVRKVRKKKYAYGGYMEDRSWYARSPLFGKQRSIHLAVDIWAEEGSAIFAPIEGKIHSFADNSGFGNYGPTLILEHQVEGEVFYTLYGHLSKNNMANWQIGRSVQQGEQIGELGSMNENGDWPAHLHFQIIKDLQGKEGDYPGVSSNEDVQFYQSNCPDPKYLLRF
ncbi:MAG TPA: peptidoglycan DD-metalloendopeptidase family protein [Chitinophagales bacterium]|nr:peptidoglycan DD-metalloendopeptidase family protein [Chitinophagales bacterium]